MTVCNTSNMEKTSEEETQAVAGTNSLHSSRGIFGFCATQRREPGNQEKHQGQDTQKANRRKETKSQSTSVLSVIFILRRMQEEVLTEAGNDQFRVNPSRRSRVLTNHVVLDITFVFTRHVVLKTSSVKQCS